MHRLAAANAREIARADTKAAVLLAFVGTLLGAFITLTRVTAHPLPAEAPEPPTAGWWSAVVLMLLATCCFIFAIVPRRRGRRETGPRAPVYFGDVPPGIDDQRLLQRFEELARAPETPLRDSLRRTSGIVRAKYRWIESGAVLLLTALPALVTALPTT